MENRTGKAVLAATCVTILAMFSFLILSARGSGQGKERSVRIENFRDQPIEIVAVKVKGTPVDRDREFKGDPDWLNGMTATIKNVSDKPVVYVTITVSAYYEKDGKRKQTSDGRNIRAATDFGYGLRPLMPGEPARSSVTTPLMPGQTIDIAFPEAKRDELEGLLKREDSVTDIAELKLWVDRVAWLGEFDKMWIRGKIYRLDPNKPRTWVPIDDEDAPASRLNHAKKPKLQLAAMLGLNLAARYASFNPLPPCIYKDGHEQIEHCTAVDTRGIPCDRRTPLPPANQPIRRATESIQMWLAVPQMKRT